MAQMGYLSLENRSRIMPLHLSERLLAELQFLDGLKEYVPHYQSPFSCVSKSFFFFYFILR